MKLKKLGTDPTGYLFILPFFIIFSYFYFIPIIKVIIDSFTDYDMFTKQNYIGFSNYIELASDERFIRSIGNTLVYTVGTLLPTLCLGLLLALLINNAMIKTRISRTLIFMPHVVSMVAVSMIWLYLYEPTKGVFNTLLTNLGLQRSDWLLDPNRAMLCLIIMGIWKSAGYNMMIFLSGLKNIPVQYYEAAKIDGSTPINTFFRITLPLLSPTTSFLFITGIISSFNVFDQVQVMTDGGPMFRTTTMVHQIYTAGFLNYRVGYASAMSVVLLVVVVIITVINFRLTQERTD